MSSVWMYREPTRRMAAMYLSSYCVAHGIREVGQLADGHERQAQLVAGLEQERVEQSAVFAGGIEVVDQAVDCRGGAAGAKGCIEVIERRMIGGGDRLYGRCARGWIGHGGSSSLNGRPVRRGLVAVIPLPHCRPSGAIGTVRATKLAE